MNEVDNYTRTVMQNIHAPRPVRQRIEADLRLHFEEAIREGESARDVIARMGTPLEVAEEFMAQVSLSYAGFRRRLAAFAIDMIAIILVAGVFGFAGVLLSNQVPQHPQGLDYVFGAVIILLVIAFGLAAVGMIFLYFPILEARSGQTLGKRWLRLYVLKENGLPLGYKEAFLRRISFYLEVLPIDALFILFTDKRQRAFDNIARTIVIRM